MILANGSTDVSTYFVLRDSTTHAPKADVTVTDIDVYYQEQGVAQSAKADLTALAAADSAHADNKGYHCGNSVYRIDWPDAAFDGGAGKKVILIVVCTGVDTAYLEVELSPAVGAAASVTAGVTLADDAITAAKFDESTAYPLASADTGATAVARTGADSDTLETLSDELVAMKGATFNGATDSLEAIRDRGDAEWVTATGFSTFNPATDTVARVTLVDTTTTNTDMVSAAPSAASVADAVLDEAMAGHVAAGSLGKAVADVLENTGTTIPAAITALTEGGVKKNTGLSGFTFFMTDSTNHAAATGKTVTAQRSLDGAAFASCANAVSEVSNGVYKIDLAAADTNGDVVTLRFTATACDDLLMTIKTSS